MSSLKKCLSKIGLEAHEQAIINGAVKDYRAEGYEAHKAAVEAVKDYIAQLKDERKDIEGQVREKAPAAPAELNTIQDIQDKWEARGVTISLSETQHPSSKGGITLFSLIVPKGERRRGIGSSVMRDIVNLADRDGKYVYLTPATKDDFHGTTSRRRLVKFYKNFGFVENKGRRKDFTMRESMYREPKPRFTRDPNRPYANVPDNLMGFGKPGDQKGFEETRYPAELNVTVKYPGGDEWIDAIKGMNYEHALERARRNWPGAEITPGTLVRARPLRASVNTNTKAFKKWFGKSQIVDKKGKPMVVFHGSTHDFKSFSDTRGHVGNYMGKGFYFSSSYDDVNANYAGMGPDLTSRIELEKEKYGDVGNDEARDLLSDYFWENPEILGDVDVNDLLDTDEEFEKLRDEYLDEAISMAAKNAIAGKHEGAIYPAFLKMEKPFYLDDVKSMGKSYTPIGIEIEYSEDGEEVVEERGEGVKLIEALREVLGWYEVSEREINDVAGKLYEMMVDGSEIGGGDIMAVLAELYPVDPDTGDSISSGAILKDIVKELGYDGIVMDAERHFGPRRGAMGVRLPGMQGVIGAVHFMPFEPTQIKSSIGNIGTFDPTKTDITASVRMNVESELGIPEFIGSNDAIAFGRIATIEQVDEMRRLYTLINDRAKKLTQAPELEALEQAMTQAYRAQFLHEAVMAAEGHADEMDAKGMKLAEALAAARDTELDEPKFSVKKRAGKKQLALFDLKPPEVPGVNLEKIFRVKVQTTGHIAAAGNVVLSVDDAASLLAPIRKAAQENAFVVMLGGDGTVLEIHRYSKGTKNSANVDPVEVMGRAGNTPGTKAVVFAHNHPSGGVEPSVEDIGMAQRLEALGAAEGIRVHSLVIGGSKFVDISSHSKEFQVPRSIRPTVRTLKIPVKERFLAATSSGVGAHLAKPDDAKKWLADNHPNTAGIMLLDNQNNVMGWLNNLSHLTQLDAFAEIVKAMEITNSNGLIFVSPTKLSPEMRVFIGRVAGGISAGNRVMDVLEAGESLTEKNTLGRVIVPFSNSGAAILQMNDEKRSISELKGTFSLRRRDINRAFERGMMSAEDIAIGNDLDALAVLDRALGLGGGGRPPQHWQNIDAQLDANPYMVKKIRQIERRAGVRILDKNGHILKDDIEARTKVDTGQGKFNKKGDIVPRFKGFYRSFAQTYLDALHSTDPDTAESFRRAIVRSIEEAYSDPAIAVKGELGLTFANMASKKDYAIGRPLRKADKTMAALNLNTMCPMMTVGLHGCYIDGCYVVGLAQAGQIVNYYNSAMYTAEILQMKDGDVARLNAAGGLRVNGMGDTQIQDFGQWADIFRHAEMRGLMLKVITKQDATMEVIDRIRKSKKIGSTLAANTVIQTSIDPYWVEVMGVDDVAGSATRRLGVIDKINAGDLQGAADTIKKEFHREAKVLNGKVFRKYGYSWEQLKGLAKKYPKLKFLPRVVVATPKEIAEYALRMPEVLQTWMHAKLRPGMWSDIEGAPITQANALNFKYQIAVRKVDGEWRILRQKEKASLEAGESEPYTKVEEYIKANYKPADQEKIFSVLAGHLRKDPSSLCCGISASKDACQTCQSTCAHGSYHTGTDFAELTRRGTIEMGKALKAIGRTPDLKASMRRPESAPGPVWYSRMEAHIADKMPGRVPAGDLMPLLESYVRSGQISRDELMWSGIENWAAEQTGKVTKRQVLDYLATNNIRVEEVLKGSFDQESIAAAQEAIGELEDRGYAIEYSENMDGEPYPNEIMLPRKYGSTLIALSDYRSNLAELEMVPQEDLRLIEIVADTVRRDESSAVFGPDKAPDLNIPGGKKGSYRELLLLLPAKSYEAERRELTRKMKEAAKSGNDAEFDRLSNQKKQLVDRESFRSTHYQEPDILAHIRFDERYTSADGTPYTPPIKVLFLQEVQSDWGQKGRKEGFQQEGFDPVKQAALQAQWFKFVDEGTNGTPEAQAVLRELQAENNKNLGRGIPAGPFVQDTGSWAMLAMKRIIRYAAENGYDQVAWTTGKMQADRYKLSTRISEVMVRKDKGGRYEVRAYEKGTLNPIKTFDNLTPEKMEGVIGKELTKKAVEKLKGVEAGYESFKGVDLDIGGEGMVGFYERILPAEMNRFFDRPAWGKARVGTLRIPIGEKEFVKWDYSQTERAEIADAIRSEAMNRKPSDDAAYKENWKEAKEFAKSIENGRNLNGVLIHKVIERDYPEAFKLLHPLEGGEKFETVPAFAITPEIKLRSVQMGMPLFSMRNVRPSPFYSQMEEVIKERKLAGPVDQILKAVNAWAKKGDIKEEEVDWSGLREYIALNPSKKMTTKDILEYLANSNIRVVETVHQVGIPKEIYGQYDIKPPEDDGTHYIDWGKSNPILEYMNIGEGSDIIIQLLDDDQMAIVEFIKKEARKNATLGQLSVDDALRNRFGEAIINYEEAEWDLADSMGPTFSALLPDGLFVIEPKLNYGELSWAVTKIKDGVAKTWSTRYSAYEDAMGDVTDTLNEQLKEVYNPAKYAGYIQGINSGMNTPVSYRELLLIIPRPSPRGWRLELNQEETDFIGHPMYDVINQNGVVRFTGNKADSEDYMKDPGADTEERLGEKFVRSHWDEENVVVHVRLTERPDLNGGSRLFIEEIQSDWHQKGRKSRYRGPGAIVTTRLSSIPNLVIEYFHNGNPMYGLTDKKTMFTANEVRFSVPIKGGGKRVIVKIEQDGPGFVATAYFNPSMTQQDEIRPRHVGMEGMRDYRSLFGSIEEAFEGVNAFKFWHEKNANFETAQLGFNQNHLETNLGPSVPEAPFQKTWPLLAIKRMVRWAAENGYQSISWSTGLQQYGQWGSERFDWRYVDDPAEPTVFPTLETVADAIYEQDREVAFRWKPQVGKWASDALIKSKEATHFAAPDGYYYSPVKNPSQIGIGSTYRAMFDEGAGEFVAVHLNEDYYPEARKGWEVDGHEQFTGAVFANLQERMDREAFRDKIFIDHKAAADGKRQLRGLVEKIMGREKADWSQEKWSKHIDSLTNKIWDAMRNGENMTGGRILPRYDGMVGFYDDRLVKDVNAFFDRKQWGNARVATEMLYMGDPENAESADTEDFQVVHSLYLPPELRAKALEKGMPLFSMRRIRPPGETYLEAVNSVLGQPSITTDEDTTADPFGGLDPEIKKSLGESKGIVPANFRQRLKQNARDIWYSLSRHRPYLDPGDDGQITDILRVHQDVGENSVRRAMQILEKIISGLKPKQYQVFTMSLVMDDMIKDRESGLLDDPENLPFGFTEEKARAYRDYLKALVAADPAIKAALGRREAFMKKLRRALVAADLLHESVLGDERYFHHQVLEYKSYQEDKENYPGLGVKSQDVRMQKKGWQKGRVGSIAEYNTDYAEAEFEVISQGIAQLETMHTMNQIKDRADITPRLAEEAKLANYVAIVGGQENYDRLEVLRGEKAEIQANKPLDSGDKARLKAINEEIWALDPTMPFRSKIAQGYARLAKALGIEVDEGIEDGELGMKEIAKFANSDNDDESIPARMIMKAIADRRKFIKETLGKNFKTPKSLMPPGYTTWMPSKGQSWYKAFTITDRLVAAINEGEATLGQENADKIKTVLAKAKNPEWIIPVGLAKTLDGYDMKYEDHWMSKRSRQLMSGWKSWTLLSPPRVLKYNLNNMSGDLDIVVAYRPEIFYKYFWKAFADLSKDSEVFWQKNKDMGEALRKEIELAYSLGVLGSGWSVQEVSDVSGQLALKQRLDAITGNDPSLIAKYWENTKKFTQFRENLLRFAAFRYFRDQLEAGKNVYGASNRDEVDGIVDNDRKAAKLARELLGDYGNITHAGLWMRAHTIPFYSWMEVNAPRYVRLLRNLPYEEGSGTLGAARIVAAGGAKVAGAVTMKTLPLVMKMAGFWVLASLWNKLRFPEEEEELGEQQRAQMHLILGRREDGSIITMRLQGAFSDALSWFGLETAVADVTKMIAGKKSISDQAKDMLLATPKKVIGAVRPDVKAFAELLSGKSFYPDPFHPRTIRDRVEYIARTFSLGSVYNWAAGRPKRGDDIYKQIFNDLAGLLTYTSDPGEMAYYDVTRIVSDYKQDAGPDPKDKADAMYYYKQALKFGDIKAAAKYLQRYRDLGGTEKAEIGAIKRAHPLGQLAKKDQAKFKETLSEEELYRLQLAEEWYNRTYRGETREAAKAMINQEPPEEEDTGMTLREGIKLLK